MRTRKSVISILLAVMMIFTFMPAMAFADVYDYDTTPTSGEITSISWGSDYHTASVKVKVGTVTSTYNFDYFDTAEDAMPAEKADDTKDRERLVVMPQGLNPDGTVTYELGVVWANPDATGSHDYKWDADTFEAWTGAGYTFTYTRPAKVENMTKSVFDAYYLAERIQTQKVDAGAYGAWYAQKDLPEAKRTETGFDSFENGLLTATHLNKKYFDVTYPAYDAYEYDTVNNKNVNKELSITIALKADEIKANIDNDALVSTATGTVKLIPEVTVANHQYYTEPLRVRNNQVIGSWYVTDNKSFNVDFPETFDREIMYDGATHKVAFLHEPKGVTVKYYITQGDKNGNYVQPKASDWTTTCPETIKDAGKYYVALQFVTNKDNTTYNEDGQFKTVITVTKMPLFASFKQDVLKAEYGKYDAASLEKAINEMLVATDVYGHPVTAPDVQDKLNEAVHKYVKVNGLFTDAGKNTLWTEVDEKGLSDDTALAEALKNYKLYGTGRYEEGPNGMALVIEKADNDTVLKSVTKTYKAKKKTKKLAKKKTFKLSATSDFGTLKFKKVKGNSKIKVNAAGTVTVNKGLKKGTHKVTVQAYTKGTANYAAGSDTTEIYVTIK